MVIIFGEKQTVENIFILKSYFLNSILKKKFLTSILLIPLIVIFLNTFENRNIIAMLGNALK